MGQDGTEPSQEMRQRCGTWGALSHLVPSNPVGGAYEMGQLSHLPQLQVQLKPLPLQWIWGR